MLPVFFGLAIGIAILAFFIGTSGLTYYGLRFYLADVRKFLATDYLRLVVRLWGFFTAVGVAVWIIKLLLERIERL